MNVSFFFAPERTNKQTNKQTEDRDKDWIATLENDAAKTMQRLYWVWFQRQQFEKVRWKAKKKFREVRE